MFEMLYIALTSFPGLAHIHCLQHKIRTNFVLQATNMQGLRMRLLQSRVLRFHMPKLMEIGPLALLWT